MNIIRNAINYYLRYLIQIPSIYRDNEKPHIFLFATRRSGSTLLRDMIYSQPEFNYIDQPLDIWQFNPNKKYLPVTELGQYICLDESSKERVRLYLERALSRKIIIRSQWQFWDKNYHWIWNRYILKILSANPMIEWFYEIFKDRTKIVYLTRHPIPSALSASNLNWGVTASAYLNNSEFKYKYLSKESFDYSANILNHGSTLEKFVLNWCLENLIPLRLWQRKNWMITVSYENIIAQPNKSVQRLCHLLNLTEPNRMLEMVYKPSRTSVKMSRRKILNKGPKSILNQWCRKVGETEQAKVQQLLNLFDIRLYNAYDVYPNQEFDER